MALAGISLVNIGDRPYNGGFGSACLLICVGRAALVARDIHRQRQGEWGRIPAVRVGPVPAMR
jgi:hypothetical protein